MKIGDSVRVEYELVKLIRRDGLGALYEGRQCQFDHKVYIRLLHKNATVDQDAIRRYFEHARAASRRSNRIARIYDTGFTENSMAFVVMEHFKGKNLGEILNASKSMNSQEISWVGIEICHALESVHRNGLIHRNLNIENIYVVQSGDEKNRVKIIDFGLAEVRDSFVGGVEKLSSFKERIDLPFYIAPEYALEKPTIDRRADIYSLGAILYELFSGVPPYKGENFADVLSQCSISPPPTIEKPKNAVQRELERIILRAMKINPKDRMSRTSTVAELLAPFSRTNISDQGREDTVNLTDSDVMDVVEIDPKKQPLSLLESPQKNKINKLPPPLRTTQSYPSVRLVVVLLILIVGAILSGGVVYECGFQAGTAFRSATQPGLQQVSPPLSTPTQQQQLEELTSGESSTEEVVNNEQKLAPLPEEENQAKAEAEAEQIREKAQLGQQKRQEQAETLQLARKHLHEKHPFRCIGVLRQTAVSAQSVALKIQCNHAADRLDQACHIATKYQQYRQSREFARRHCKKRR